MGAAITYQQKRSALEVFTMAEKRKPAIRQRPIQVKFFVDEKELDLIKQKMAQMGTDNMSAYLRKMAIDGYVVNLDMPELRELTSKMKRISNSENQIAKQLNLSLIHI